MPLVFMLLVSWGLLMTGMMGSIKEGHATYRFFHRAGRGCAVRRSTLLLGTTTVNIWGHGTTQQATRRGAIRVLFRARCYFCMEAAGLLGLFVTAAWVFLRPL